MGIHPGPGPSSVPPLDPDGWRAGWGKGRGRTSYVDWAPYQSPALNLPQAVVQTLAGLWITAAQPFAIAPQDLVGIKGPGFGI
jgi:hypothetical protein